MNAMALMATLGLDTSGYESGLRGATSDAHSFASTIKKVLGGIAIGAAVKKITDGVASLTKSAVAAYADYEQLVGGVETLFGNGGKSFEQYAANASDSLYSMGQKGAEVLKLQKELVEAGYDIGSAGADGIYGPKTKAAFDAYAKAGGQMVRAAYDNTNAAAEKVQKNADEAYKTAGLSANEYMETAIGFSGALLGSLAGDTNKAADMTDMAIRDMADQANKYGKTVEEVSATYTSLARGNFMTLDNLFGGQFKGTKQGLRDMLKYAEQYQKSLGNTVKYSEDSYADIISAIHDVSVATGVYGTTASEAADTIQGSFSSTKAAWKNLLLSFATGKDINKRLDSLVDSAKNVVKNVVPVVTTSLKSISGFIGEVAPIIAQELPGIITEAGPAFLNAAGSLIGSFVSNVPAMLSGLGGAIVKAITGNENASWSEVGKAIHDGIASAFTGGVNDLKKMLGIQDGASWNEIGMAISNGAKSAFSEGVSFVKSLLGIEPGMSWAEIGSAIVDGANSAITNGANFIKGLLGIEESASWPEVGQAIVSGIKSVFDGGEGGADVGQSIVSFITNAIESVGGIAAAIGKALAGAISGGGAELGLVAFKSGLLAKLLAAISDITSSLIKAGDDIIGAIAEGIAEGIPGLQGKADEVKGIIEGIIGFVTVMKIIGYANTIAGGLKAAFAGIATAATGLNPVALGIAAVVGILIYFWNTSKEFREGVGEIWNGIVEGVGKAVEDLKSRFEQLKEAMETAIAFLKDPMGEWDRRNEKLKLQAEAEVEVKPEFVFAHPELVSEEDKQALMDEFVQQFEGGTLKIGLDTTIAEESAAGAAAAGESVAAEIGLAGETGAGELESALALAGVSAGGAINGSLIDNITSASQTAAQALQTALSAAGNAAAAGIQAALRGLQLPSLSIGVQTTQQMPGVGRKKHASAMAHGEILQGLTPFGVDSFGTVHYGGEAGPEAVVGVNSLDGMIQRSVQKAVAAVLSKMDELRAGQNQGGMQVVLDSGALVGGIKREMDRQMGSMATWRGGGRA